MVLGDKLWEGKGKSMSTVVKGANADGVTLEATWSAQLRGMGRAKGLDGQVTFTGNILMGPTGSGNSIGQGIMNTMTGDMAVVKGYGYGYVEGGKSKSVGIWNFMTMSQKLTWMNSAVAIVTLEGDPQWMEFDIVVHEWK
ncbi:MAG: ATP-cone protein [Thermoproteota archaeon]|nr:ATP-cone protein [Thermoproteota archaeon]